VFVNTCRKQVVAFGLGVDIYEDDSFSDYSWIDEELPEDVDFSEDPNYFHEEVAENFNTTALITKNYDLRPRTRSRH